MLDRNAAQDAIVARILHSDDQINLLCQLLDCVHDTDIENIYTDLIGSEVPQHHEDTVKKVTKLTFEIITTGEWNDHGVNALQEEFEGIYAGNLNIASACLVKAETIDEPEEDE